MCSASGVTDEKLLALTDSAHTPDSESDRQDLWRADDNGLFSERERVALRYADAMTLSDQDVSDDLFHRLREHFDDDCLVELTAAIAWENASSKFNRALRIGSQGLWKRNAKSPGSAVTDQ